MYIDTFSRKILLVTSNKKEADWISHLFSEVGGAALEVETSTTNLIPRLQDDSIEACLITDSILYENFNSYTIGCERIMQACKQDPKASKKPVVIIDFKTPEEKDLNWALDYYRAGAHLVVVDGLSKESALRCLLQLDSILSLLDNYKSTERKYAFRV